MPKPGTLGYCERCDRDILSLDEAICGVAAGSYRLVTVHVECAPAPDDPFWSPAGAFPSLVGARGD